LQRAATLARPHRGDSPHFVPADASINRVLAVECILYFSPRAAVPAGRRQRRRSNRSHKTVKATSVPAP